MAALRHLLRPRSLALRTRAIATRRSVRVVVVAWVAACGGNQPAASPTPHAAVIAQVSCADAAAILRGSVVRDDPQAGRERERAIATACASDHWTPAVLACVGKEPQAQTCLARLSAAQHASYERVLAAWTRRFGGDSYGGDDIAVINDGAPEVTCAAAAEHANDCPPALPPGDAERTAAAAMRAHALATLCDHDSWDNSVKQCLQLASDDVSCTQCVSGLDPAARGGIAARLAELDAVTAKLAALHKRAIDCKQAALAHYSDARWKQAAVDGPADDQKRMLADSRATLQKACTAEAWPQAARACVVAGGGDDCFPATPVTSPRWGFPAAGVPLPLTD